MIVGVDFNVSVTFCVVKVLIMRLFSLSIHMIYKR